MAANVEPDPSLRYNRDIFALAVTPAALLARTGLKQVVPPLQSPTRLKGMADYGPEDVLLREAIGAALCTHLAGYGYRRIDTPVLEPTDLLLRKSGGELASRMYTFSDPGGHRVSLRPELTSSVVRAYLDGLHPAELPARYCYLGPVFRYQVEEGAGYRQFTQAGAEVLGAKGPGADAEVMAMACQGIARLGVSGCQLVVGHLGFVGALLESLGLSDRARLFLLSHLSQLGRGPEGVAQVREQASALELLRGGAGTDGSEAAPLDEAGIALIERYFQTTSAASAFGVRTPQEIRERFLRKQSLRQGAEHVGEALELVAQVSQVRGAPAQAFGKVRGLVRAPAARAEMDRLEEALGLLSHYGLDGQVSLDLGLGRGIAYYTGVVFEVHHAIMGDVSLGGGGRYDGLAQALGGGEPIPAMGFAWTLEHVVELVNRAGLEHRWRPQGNALLVRARDAVAQGSAIQEAERLRGQGYTVEIEPSLRPLRACVLYAQARAIKGIATVDRQGKVVHTDVPERQ
ncbi:MAG: ATP phosphoribosyltransferase regulatory subunit [Chloroflexi bacterium]|nr:ATP phosphoribosyltransferase regulatory subunit [Chloroflexota bacterium]